MRIIDHLLMVDVYHHLGLRKQIECCKAIWHGMSLMSHTLKCAECRMGHF
jgi:hypothetical protein